MSSVRSIYLLYLDPQAIQALVPDLVAVECVSTILAIFPSSF